MKVRFKHWGFFVLIVAFGIYLLIQYVVRPWVTGG